RGAAERPGTGSAARSGGTGSLQLMDYPWPPPYRTRAVQQLIKGLAWGPPTSRAVWAALESPITATAAPTSTTSLPATTRPPGPAPCRHPSPGGTGPCTPPPQPD